MVMNNRLSLQLIQRVIPIGPATNQIVSIQPRKLFSVTQDECLKTLCPFWIRGKTRKLQAGIFSLKETDIQKLIQDSKEEKEICLDPVVFRNASQKSTTKKVNQIPPGFFMNARSKKTNPSIQSVSVDPSQTMQSCWKMIEFI